MSRRRAQVLLPHPTDRRLTAMSIALGRSRSELVTLGVALVEEQLTDAQRMAVQRAETFVAEREESEA